MTKTKLRTKRLIMAVSKLSIILLQTAMYGWLWYTHYKDQMPIQYWRRGNWAVIALYGVLVFFFSRTFGSLKVGYLRTWDVMYSQFFSILCVNAITYIQLLLFNGDWKFLEHVVPILWLAVAEFALVLIWALFMRWIYAIIYPPHEILVIYGDTDPKGLIHKLESRRDKYSIKETISIKHASFEMIKEKISGYHAVLIGDIPSHDRNQYIKFCFEHNIRCYGIPKISDIMIIHADSIDIFDSPMLLFRNSGLNFYQSFLKRAMDIVFSLIALILISPIMLLISLCIKLYDGGPILYTQKRLTRDYKEFDILKFRSMIVDSERHGARLAKADDDRITPVGKIIRRLHFDELPQLLNILHGEMSIVGPRPERKEITEEYKKEIPEFGYRLKVKAGLTGYAQVYGQYNTTPYDKLKMDLNYIESYSTLLDIKLMFLTVKILFQKEKSEGVDNNQKTALK
ncbi:MAG: exopolysaccharide biosynthesis polyprenyl glycosylphosphotransferase [Lachnospiraceae bacterium]